MKAQICSFANRLVSLSLALLVFAGMCWAQAQASSADLIGTVVDPTGAVVAGASITARNPGTGISRTVTTDDAGEYQIIGLPPGEYEVTAQAPTFKRVVISPVRLTVGQRAELRVELEIGEQTAVVNVSGDEAQLVETTQTTVSNTIDQQRIENLPINERSATGFALTISTVGRDNGRPIGPAPTSGLNIGGQRGRSTLVQVDGSDFTDNSINAARTTVSQEAVQEYQVATNSYNAEFGRATGGIINVVTKRGTNDFTGNVFGFIRDKRIQARNPFSPIDQPDFRRTQFGATLGGPLVKDRMFFFGSYEGRRRDETGFFTSDVRRGLTSSVTIGAPFLPFSQTFGNITSQQAAFVQGLITTAGSAITQGQTLIAQGQAAIGAGNVAQGQALIAAGQTAIAQGQQAATAGIGYAYLASGGASTALTGTNPLLSPGGTSTPIPAGTLIGQRFFLSGLPVPINANAFRPLNDLQRIFPVMERAHFASLRFDHNINDANQFTMRFGYNPVELTGIQVESQNQSLGQNDFSRTGITDIKDYSATVGLNSTLSGTTANEFRFQFGKRATSFRSQNGEAVAFNISGAAFIGRELFSPVERTETRFQFIDNFNWVVGNHTFKFGGDFNFVTIPEALFELNFAGLFNFSDFNAANLGFPSTAPAFTPVQSYGLGLPQNYIQGFGNPISQIENKPIAFFAQDTWKVTNKLTLNYGVRYDVELTKQIDPVGLTDPLSRISLTSADILAAQNVIGVQQGFPRDTNNWAPRFGFAYDLTGDGKTVVRGAVGLFYDHPLLAVAFNSDIADATQQQQAVLTAGAPSLTGTSTFTIISGGTPTSQTFTSGTLLNAAQVFQGTVCTPASANPICPPGFNTAGAAPTAQYQFGRQRFNDQTFTGLGAVLPFTLPVAQDFKYASATQANLTFERQIGTNMSVQASLIHVRAKNLPHPTDINAPRQDLQIQNFQRFANRLPNTAQEAVASVAIPSGTSTSGLTVGPGTLFTNNFGVTCAVVIPGMVAQCPNGRVVTPAIANFFRPNAPNYFLAAALSGGAVTKAVLDAQLVGSLRTPGLISPFGAVNAQVSDGNSDYNALNVEVRRRFANNFTFLASYTLSHTIDDSSDLQTLLIAQNPRNHRAERANSLFDQRHRFVFSGVLASPTGWRSSSSGWKKFLADFTIAPIIEISSGRPFNIITNVDSNNDQSTSTDRPRVLSDGTLCVPGEPLSPGVTCGTIFENDPTLNGALSFATGSLGRNMGIIRGYASLDLRISRSIRFGERTRLELIAEGFNLFNRFNEASASPNYRDVNAFGRRDDRGRYYSIPTAAYDPRQFQFGAKFHF